jgi:hypothetical protein
MSASCARPDLVALAIGVMWLSAACEQRKAATPPELQTRFEMLRDSLSAETPGASVARLTVLLADAKRYQLADSVHAEINVHMSAVEGRYHAARELARDGKFEEAEVILSDLALLPDTDDGKSSRQHLEVDFYMEKARWLLVRQRFDEVKVVASDLLKRDLTRFQRDEVERLLDYTGHGNAAMEMVSRQQARDACKQLIIFVANIYVNDGYYPASLSIADLKERDPYSSQFIVSALSSIENYSASQDHYRLTAVSKSSERFLVVDGNIQE